MTSPFERLPRELRRKILKEAIEPLEVSFDYLSSCYGPQTILHSPPITRVSHTIRTDALAVLYEESEWVVSCGPGTVDARIETVIRKMGPAFARSVRHFQMKARRTVYPDRLPYHLQQYYSVWRCVGFINLVQPNPKRSVVRDWWEPTWYDQHREVSDDKVPVELLEPSKDEEWREGDKLATSEKRFLAEMVQRRIEGRLEPGHIVQLLSVDWLREQDIIPNHSSDVDSDSDGVVEWETETESEEEEEEESSGDDDGGEDGDGDGREDVEVGDDDEMDQADQMDLVDMGNAN